MAKKKATNNRGKNLLRTADSIINQRKVQLTNEEVRAFQNLVRRVNRKRAKMIEQFRDEPIFYGNRRLPEDRTQLNLMGEELDLVIRKRSASLHKFTSRRQFQAEMRKLQKVADIDYLNYRGKLYKRNYLTMLKEQYGEYPELLKGVLMRVQMTNQKDFQKLIGSDRLFQIKEHYSTRGKLERLKALREKLGLQNPDYEEEEETY